MNDGPGVNNPIKGYDIFKKTSVPCETCLKADVCRYKEAAYQFSAEMRDNRMSDSPFTVSMSCEYYKSGTFGTSISLR